MDDAVLTKRCSRIKAWRDRALLMLKHHGNTTTHVPAIALSYHLSLLWYDYDMIVCEIVLVVAHSLRKRRKLTDHRYQHLRVHHHHILVKLLVLNQRRSNQSNYQNENRRSIGHYHHPSYLRAVHVPAITHKCSMPYVTVYVTLYGWQYVSCVRVQQTHIIRSAGAAACFP